MKIIYIFLISMTMAIYANSTIESGTIDVEERETSGTVAVLAGGCFWGVEAVFERLKGVDEVLSGYSGGRAEYANYKHVSSGLTDHAESVKIVFNPEIISYQTLLEIFFLVAHNPTQLNYQGPDYGREYRSAIFYTDEEQRLVAKEYIEALDKSGIYPTTIVTELTELVAFYTAEEYHQNYMERNPNNPYIIQCDVPKIEDLEARYSHLLKEEI